MQSGEIMADILQSASVSKVTRSCLAHCKCCQVCQIEKREGGGGIARLRPIYTPAGVCACLPASFWYCVTVVYLSAERPMNALVPISQVKWGCSGVLGASF